MPAPRGLRPSPAAQPRHHHHHRSRRHSGSTIKTSSATPKSVRDSLLQLRLRAQDSTGLAQSCPNEECVICAEVFCTNDVVTILGCGHMHHSNCILHWLHRQSTCPTCRFDVNHKHVKGDECQFLLHHTTDSAVDAQLAFKSFSVGTVVQQKSENWDLILRRTLRMKMEVHDNIILTNYHADSDAESVSNIDNIDADPLPMESPAIDAMDHAHFLELYAGIRSV